MIYLKVSGCTICYLHTHSGTKLGESQVSADYVLLSYILASTTFPSPATPRSPQHIGAMLCSVVYTNVSIAGNTLLSRRLTSQGCLLSLVCLFDLFILVGLTWSSTYILCFMPDPTSACCTLANPLGASNTVTGDVLLSGGLCLCPRRSSGMSLSRLLFLASHLRSITYVDHCHNTELQVSC